MVILVDTNVVCDVLEKREPFFTDSLSVLKLCEIRKVKGYFSSLSFSNICYLYRKEWNNDDIKYWLNVLCGFLIFINLDIFNLEEAYSYNFKDYEDAVQLASANRVCADYIVTRNTKDYKNSTIKAVTPSEFLKLYAKNKYPKHNIAAEKAKDDYEMAKKHFAYLNKSSK